MSRGSANSQGLLLVISGPSGAGKTTIAREVEKRMSGLFSVSVTTRPKGPGDVEGRDYFFLTPEQFRARRDAGELLEYAEVFDKHSYGTPRGPVEQALADGKLMILEIDVQGALQVKEKMPEAFMIFILPPSDEALLTRLRRRGRDAEDAIQRRFQKAKREIEVARASGAYDAFIVNDDLERAVNEACAMVRARREQVRGEARLSGPRLGPRLRALFLFLLLFLTLAGAAHAGAVKGVRAALDEPIAVRGGVLMLPLIADSPGDNWPQAIDLRLRDGRVLEGRVAWVHELLPPLERHWTDDPRYLGIRAIERTDDSAKVPAGSGLGPYLLATLPENAASGEIRFGKQVLRPVWLDLPRFDPLAEESPEMLRDRPALELARGPDRPDVDSPFEYWRWVLLADRLGANPPPPAGDEIAQMAAQHYAALWRIGLGRLAALSRNLAGECRDLLTKTAIDRRQPFAVWVTDPSSLGALLAHLLDFKRPDDVLLSGAVTWVDEQPPLFLWPVSEAGDEISLMMATSRSETVIAKLTWRGSATPASAVRLEPGVFAHVSVLRPPLPLPPALGFPAPPEPGRLILRIESEGREYDLAFGPRRIIARPPAVFLRTLSPPLTLAEVQATVQRPVPPERATFVQVRRLSGCWEIFFECRRPQITGAYLEALLASGDAAPASPRRVEDVRSYDDLRGIESVTLLLGSDIDDATPPSEASLDDPAAAALREPVAGSLRDPGRDPPRDLANANIWVTIPEDGWSRVIRGANDPNLQVHRKSFSDRWYCRVVLPEAWVYAAPNRPLRLGVIRGHDDSRQLETGPSAALPWRPAPARAALDLSEWDDLPAVDE